LRKFWRAALTISVIVNVFGLIWALITREMMHSAGHAVLLAATLAAWQGTYGRRDDDEVAETPQLDLHLDHLQQSVDAIALEVERIGEAQRFATKVLQEDVNRENSAST
jgi:hypothetical protein